MTEQDWDSAADPMRRVGRRVEFHAAIGSTNDRARAALVEPPGDGLAVVADLQTAGRGRRGRTWASPAGANLMVSVGVRPRLSAARAGLLGIAAALAVRDASAELLPANDLRVKWPNDVVTVDGRKVAGLLVETAISGDAVAEAIIGMGINVNWPVAEMPADLQGRAASLCDLAGGPRDRVELLRRLMEHLDRELAALERGESPLERLATVSALDGRRVVIDTGDGQQEGTALGLTDDGQLLLETNGGRQTLAIGEVVSVRTEMPAGAAP
ncbi:MAG TPA: biotin--[acetyl-CoA-carboxylase] ligase [Candidatus Limnocylindria bacterium]|nr:biotin--[acetyl-CoA-carboxylase] ligase [Candidatus Limnocylindria bacterium]